MLRNSFFLSLIISLLVHLPNITAQSVVTVYYDANYGGKSQSFGVGKHDIGSLDVVGNDQISSIKVANGYQVEVFLDARFSGGSRTYKGDIAFVGDINDKISSLVVSKLGDENQSADNYVAIKCRWQKTGGKDYYVYLDQQTKVLDALPIASTGNDLRYWNFEQVAGTPYYRIKLRWDDQYALNTERGGKLEAGPIQEGWLSAMWELEKMDATYYRIKNRWTNTYLNIQGANLSVGNIEPGWWSAMWELRGLKNPVVDDTKPAPNPNPGPMSFSVGDINKRNVLGVQPLPNGTPPPRTLQKADWNYTGNMSRQEINANGLGRCYDVRRVDLLNWTAETLNSGKTSYVFDLYRDDSARPARFNNADYVVPFGVTFQSAIQSDAEEQYKFIVTANEFESEVTQEYRANVGVPKLGSAKVSVAFNNASSSANKNENMYAFTKMYKQYYKLDANLDNPTYKHQINSRLWNAVRQLGYEMSAEEFIEQFGTHFASTAYYGGNYLQRRSVNKSEFSTSTHSEREFKMDVEATIKKINVGVGTTQGSSSSSSNSNSITVSDKKVYTIGGDPSFDNPQRWANTVIRMPEVIKGQLTRISALLTKAYFPEMSDIDNKRKLLEVAIAKAERDAGDLLSQPTANDFYSKTPVEFRLTVWGLKCTGQGSGEPGDESEYYGKLAMGYFSNDRKQLGGKACWDQNIDHKVSFATNQTRELNQVSTMTIYPKDFADGYAKIWGWMKEGDSFEDTKMTNYNENDTDGAIYFRSAMGFNKVPGTLTFTSGFGDSVTVSYELQRIK
jgi:hypothetical protein